MITPTGVTAAEYWAAIKAGRPTHVRLTFYEQNIVLDDSDVDYNTHLTLTDVFNGDYDLVFGRAVSKQIHIGIRNSSKLENLNWSGEFMLEMGVDIGIPATTNWVTIGFFSGEKPNNITVTNVIDFTVYDRMKMFDFPADDFLATVTFPATVQDIYDALCLYVGLQNDAGDELMNIMSRSYSEAPVDMKGYTCRDVLAWIAEASGCYAKINNAGHAQLKWYTDNTEHVVTGNEEFDIESIDVFEGLTWDEADQLTWDEMDQKYWEQVAGSMDVYKIDQLKVLQLEAEIEVNYPNVPGSNIYVIVDNPFLRISSVEERNNYIVPLYERLNAFSGYMPIRTECVGSWLVEAGDILTIDVYGHTLQIPVFMKTMYWNGGVRDEYETTGNKERPAYGSAANQEKILSEKAIKLQVKGKYDRINGIVIDEDGVEITGNKSIILDSSGNVLIHAGHEFDKWNFDSSGLEFEGHAVDSDVPVPGRYVRFGIQPFTGESVPNAECGLFPQYDFNAQYASLILRAWKYRSNTSITKPQQAHLHIEAIDTLDNDEGYSDEGSQICLYTDRTSGNAVAGWLGTRTYMWRRIYGETVYYYFLESLSTREAKDNIQPVKDFGDAIDKLQPVSFMYKTESAKKSGGRTSYGLVYEDAVEVMPEICTGKDEKGINYMALIPILLSEVQHLRKRVAELEKAVSTKDDEKSKGDER